MPTSAIPMISDYGLQAQSIERNRRLAELMQQSSMEPAGNPMSGGWAVPTSPFQGLNKMAQGYVGQMGQNQADARQMALAAQMRGQAQDWMKSMPQGTPATPGTSASFGQSQGGPDADLSGIDQPIIPGTPGTPAAPPSREQMLTWLMRGQYNPMTAPMATKAAGVLMTPASADAQLRRQTTLETHNTPSADASLAESGRNARMLQVPASTVYTQEQETERRGTLSAGEQATAEAARGWGEPYDGPRGTKLQRNTVTGQVREVVSQTPASVVIQGMQGQPSPMAGTTPEQFKSMTWDELAAKMKVPMSGAALELASKNYYFTGQMPQMGMGGRGTAAQVRVALMEGRTKVASELGVSPEEAVAKPPQWKANANALSTITKDITTFEPYKNMLDVNGNIAIQLGNKISQTNAALANRPINWLKQNATNNPDVAEYMFQINTVQTEAARVLNNPRLVGELSVEAKRDMQAVLSGNMPIPAAAQVIHRMQNDGSNRLNAMKSQAGGLNAYLSGRPSPSPQAAPQVAPAATAAPTVTPRVRRYNPATGTLE